MVLDTYMEHCRALVNAALNDKLIVTEGVATPLQHAMKYAVLNGGKRVRSIFVYAVGELFNADKKILTELSCVIEMIHAFSLVHDDLPALDNDDLRRGLPSCHKAFDEATAILAGDALLTLAFATISKLALSSDKVVHIMNYVADTTGVLGLISGEHQDLSFVANTPDVVQLEQMYALKTSCLINASVVVAAIAGGCIDAQRLKNLELFGNYLGISFQIHDDIIGIESDTATLGKKQNADSDLNKPIYPVLVGMEQAKRRRDELYDLALSHLKEANCCSEQLMALSQFVINRNY